MSTNTIKKLNYLISDSTVAIFFLFYTYFLSLVPVFCGLEHIYFPMYIISFALLFYRLLFDCSFFDNHGNGYLILFVAAFLISVIFNGFSSIRNNIISGATILVSFFLLYTGSSLRSKDNLLKLTKNIARFGMVITGLNSVVSLVLLISDTSILFFNSVGRAFYIGVSNELRFTGLQGNPNIFGWVSLIGLGCSMIYLMFIKKKSKIKSAGAVLSIGLQVLCTGLSLSRGAFYGMIVGLFFMMAARLFMTFPKLKTSKLVSRIAVSAILCAALVFVGNFVFSSTLRLINSTWEFLDIEPENSTITIDRSHQSGDAWSTGRNFLITAGFKTLSENNAYAFGVSPGAAEERWVEQVDKSYSKIDAHHYVVSEGAGNMHNLFLQTLFVMGILGLAILLGFVFFISKTLYRAFIKNKKEVKEKDVIAALIYVLFSIGTVAMVDNILIYGSGMYNAFFMLCCGILVKLLISVLGPEVAFDKVDQTLRKPFMIADNKIRSIFKKSE